MKGIHSLAFKIQIERIVVSSFLGFIWLYFSLFFCTFAATAEVISPEHLQEINQLWRESSHAFAEVNCSSCHQAEETKALVVQPNYESCRSCHEQQVETFLIGKHGIRLVEGLSPLEPSMAQLPMKVSAASQQMTCNTCHNVHSVNTYEAAVDSCLSCHNDTHSLNYKKSKHGELFLAEGKLPRPSVESVTCATCHLPRQHDDRRDTVFVNHNNTYNLLPRDRMVADVCMHCHGMEYSYNSIFDDELITNNFARPPDLDLDTLKMVRKLKTKRSGS